MNKSPEHKAMKVFHFIHGLTFGGAETLVKDFALGLDKNKFEVTVLCSIKHGTAYESLLENAGIRVIYIHDYTKRFPKNMFEKTLLCIQRFFSVRHVLREENPDIIHIHLCLNSYVKFAKPRKGTKLFYHVHAEPTFVWRNNTQDKKDACWLVKHYGMRFITLHERMRREINEMFGVEDAVVLNNGIDFNRFTNFISREVKRTELHIPQNAFVLGHVGRFEPEKNHQFLVEIFASAVKQNENAFLLLVGDGSLKKEIESELNVCGFAGKYLILSNRSDIPDILHSMDVFLLPSLCEGLGIVLIEAQKAGVRCIASDAVPQATSVSNLITYKSLSDSAALWADTALRFSVPQITYDGMENWDMKNVIKRLEEIYTA